MLRKKIEDLFERNFKIIWASTKLELYGVMIRCVSVEFSYFVASQYFGLVSKKHTRSDYE